MELTAIQGREHNTPPFYKGKNKMKNLPAALTGLGLGLVGLYFLGVDFNLFAWTDRWGEAAGRDIRMALGAAAALLYAFGVWHFGVDAEHEPRRRKSKRLRSVRLRARMLQRSLSRGRRAGQVGAG